MTFAKESWPFVLPFALLALVLFLLRLPAWGAVSLLLALGILLFFRNPARRFDGPGETILAAADGRVLLVDRVEDPEVGPGRYQRVVTFLSVFDVHVQRAPVSGRVVLSRTRRGRKVAAFRHDAGEVNELHTTVFELPDGRRVGMRQIAGLVARRVVSYLGEGQQVERGQLVGLIKFGSRVDLLVPEGYRLVVSKGDYLRTGLTPVAVPEAAVPAEPGTGIGGGP